jgi:hypothetical protein
LAKKDERNRIRIRNSNFQNRNKQDIWIDIQMFLMFWQANCTDSQWSKVT